MKMTMAILGEAVSSLLLDLQLIFFRNNGSPNIAHAFGCPGPSDGQGLHIIDFYIDMIQANFILWNADPDVLLQIIRWLNTCGVVTNLKNGFLQSCTVSRIYTHTHALSLTHTVVNHRLTLASQIPWCCSIRHRKC